MRHHDDDNGAYLPNDADIEFAKAAIRKLWSPQEELRRQGAYRNPPAELKEVDTTSHRKGHLPLFNVELPD